MDDRDWDILLDAIHANQCVLVLGPDAAQLPGEAGGLTLAGKLAQQLSDAAAAEEMELIHAAQEKLFSSDEDYYFHDLREFFQRHDEMTTQMHRQLAQLPFSLCLQTSPDRFMYRAYLEQGKQPVESYFDFADSGGKAKVIGDGLSGTLEPNAQQPMIFGLHGHASDVHSLVLSRADTLNFLVNLAERTKFLPSILTRYCGTNDTRFLFIGFGFNNWYSQMLIHVLRRDTLQQRRRGRSIALEAGTFFDGDAQSLTATFYHHEHRIDFPQLDFAAFSSQLLQRFESRFQAQPGPDAAQVLAEQDAPLVFISYNRLDDPDDRPAVRHLVNALRGRGLRLWWDKESITGGDNWERKLRHTIAHAADYVVILHSENFTRREAYVALEVEAALARQPKFKLAEQKFIIPCHFLGHRDILPELEDIDYAVVDDPTHCDELAEAILQDWIEHDRAAAKRMG